jgi:tRNA(Arg) A34 adenosine deaminase TadA
MAVLTLPSTIEGWRKWLNAYKPRPAYPDDPPSLECVKLALEAVEAGNFGIGCVLHDPEGNEVVRGNSNHVFKPYFRSDFHGEMVVMDEFETRFRQVASMRGYKLYTSLESCPMCMARLITSGCGTVLYVAPDMTGGMVHLKDNLPPVWLDLMQKRRPPQVFGQARCSPDLQQAGLAMLTLSGPDLNQKLINR